MSLQANSPSYTRPLTSIFREHLDNTFECGQILGQLFLNIDEPDELIYRIKYLKDKGDKLTLEAHNILDLLPYSEIIQVNQQFVNYMDDIVDGINNVAQIIDIFTPKVTQEAAQDLLSTVLSMVEELRKEVTNYPNNALVDVRKCRAALKSWEKHADSVYHQWRKEHRHHSTLPLIAKMNWTKILGVLEQTTDACYHATLSLERITKYHLQDRYEVMWRVFPMHKKKQL